MSGKKYYQVAEGELRTMKNRLIDIACCDCGLVHTIRFRIVRKGERTIITRRTWCNKRATAAIRRGKQFKGMRLPK